VTKINFILSLHEMLSDLPRKDVEERLGFYSEMIEDRMEDGLPEEDAVAAVGTIDEIAAQIRAEVAANQQTEGKTASRRKLRAWEIVLLAVGSPIWLSLLITAVAVVLSVYVSLWAVVVSLWAVFGSAVGCAGYGVIGGAALAFSGSGPAGVGMIGAGFICAGLAILFFYGSQTATKGMLLLTKKTFLWIKGIFVKKEGA